MGGTARQLMDAGMRNFKSGDMAAASQEFLRLVMSFPDSDLADNAYYNLGQIYLKQGQNAKAAAAFKVILERYPGSDAASFAADLLQEAAHRSDPLCDLFQRAQDAYIQGNLEESKRLYQNLLSQDPASELADNAWFALAMIGRRQGDLQASDEARRILRERYPGSDAARLLEDA